MKGPFSNFYITQSSAYHAINCPLPLNISTVMKTQQSVYICSDSVTGENMLSGSRRKLIPCLLFPVLEIIQGNWMRWLLNSWGWTLIPYSSQVSF